MSSELLDEPISMFKRSSCKRKYYKDAPAKSFPRCSGFSAYTGFANPSQWSGPCSFRARYTHATKPYCLKHLKIAKRS